MRRPNGPYFCLSEILAGAGAVVFIMASVTRVFCWRPLSLAFANGPSKKSMNRTDPIIFCTVN